MTITNVIKNIMITIKKQIITGIRAQFSPGDQTTQDRLFKTILLEENLADTRHEQPQEQSLHINFDLLLALEKQQ